MLKITSNRHKRKYIYGSDLSKKVLDDFDWLDDPEREFFIKYKDNYYHLSEFMPIEPNNPLYNEENWSGYYGESFFSGILIEIDCEYGEDFYRIGYYIN